MARSFLTRKRFADLYEQLAARQEQEVAVAVIQRNFRGFLIRRRFRLLTRQMFAKRWVKTVVAKQRAWPGNDASGAPVLPYLLSRAHRLRREYDAFVNATHTRTRAGGFDVSSEVQTYAKQVRVTRALRQQFCQQYGVRPNEALDVWPKHYARLHLIRALLFFISVASPNGNKLLGRPALTRKLTDFCRTGRT